MLTTLFYGFMQIVEKYSAQPQMYNMVKNYSKFDWSELSVFNAYNIW